MSAKRKPIKKPCIVPCPVVPAPQNAVASFFANFFTGASGKLRAGVCIMLGSSVLLRHPELLSWLDQATANKMLAYCDDTVKLGLPALLLFCKQFNVTGGTKSVK